MLKSAFAARVASKEAQSNIHSPDLQGIPFQGERQPENSSTVERPFKNSRKRRRQQIGERPVFASSTPAGASNRKPVKVRNLTGARLSRPDSAETNSSTVPIIAEDEGNPLATRSASPPSSHDEFSESHPQKIITSKPCSYADEIVSLGPVAGSGSNDSWSTVEINLVDGDVLCLVGQYNIWVKKGSICLMGAILHASPKIHTVYAPLTHSIPTIVATANPFGPVIQHVELVITSCSTGLRQLQRYYRTYAKIWASSSSAGMHSFENIQIETLKPRIPPCFDPLPEWQKLASKLLDRQSTCTPIIMICGPKGSGKSTFPRFITNFLLSRKYSESGMGYLDLDPGQPEFSAPGDLSLIQVRDFMFGPPFTHPVVNGTTTNVVRRSHHLGAISLRDEEQHFIDCALDLFQHWIMEMQGSHSPLIVNCCGWVKGAGIEILESLVTNMKPTDVVYLDITSAEDHRSYQSTVMKVQSEFHTLPSQASTGWTRTSSDLRTMQACSYFHLEKAETDTHRWNPKPLCLQEPYRLAYAGENQVISGIVILGNEVHIEMLEEAIDGNLLALVVVEDRSALSSSFHSEAEMLLDSSDHPAKDKDTDVLSSLKTSQGKIGRPLKARERYKYGLRRTSSGLPYLSTGSGVNPPLDPSKTSTLGQILIRGIDAKHKELQVCTPILKETIEAVRRKHSPLLLVRGNIAAPGWCYLEEHFGNVLVGENSNERQRHFKSSKCFPFDGEHEVGDPINTRFWKNRPPWVEVETTNVVERKANKVRRTRRNF